IGNGVLDSAFVGLRPKFVPIETALWEIPNLAGASTNVLQGIGWLISEPFRVVVSPFVAFFTRRDVASAWFRSASMAVWAVVVWGIFGGAIARIAVVQAAGGERVGLRSALRFARRKSLSLIGAPLTPLFAVAVFAACCGLFGLL